MKPDNIHTNDDFFDYLSDIEMPAVSAEDVLDLHQRIDKKVQSQPIKGNSNGISIVLVLGFTALLFFVLFNKNVVVQIGPSANSPQDKSGDILTHALQQDTSATTNAITAKTELVAELKKPALNQEHFIKENMDTHFSEEIRSDVLLTRTVSLIDSTNTSGKLSESFLHLLPNASVIYIYDLKVTEFQKLYFRRMKPFVLEVKGLSAEFENSEAYQSYTSEKRASQDYTLDMLLKDALKMFNKQRYKQSFILFDELLNYNARDVNALFYSGLCQYNMGEYDDAKSRLNKVMESENNVFNQEAEWYKALCMVKNGEEKDGITVLLKINAQKGFYANNAAEKLKEIAEERK